MAATTGYNCSVLLKILSLMSFIHLMIGASSYKTLDQKVALGYIWENPRVEEHDASEVMVDGSRDELRLTCILDPPLPLTKDNFLARDTIVKWMKIQQTHGHQLGKTFWSDDQGITAISLSKLKLRHLGTYGCSYRSLLKTINITVSNVAEVKRLPEPTFHGDLEGVVLNIKNMNGLEQWKPLSRKPKVSLGMKNFPCAISTGESNKPNSVNRLRPKDIDIILTLGGALSAGVATDAFTVPGLFASHKTRSFSIGGKFAVEDFVTLPSIIKKFNPNVKGTVVQEETFSTMHYGSSIRQLPRRVLGVIKKLENRRDIDFKKSWKLLTLSLDFDDYCVACRLQTGWDDHIKSVVETLDVLHEKVPRLFVNLVLPPNVTQLYNLPSSRRCLQLYRKSCECLESDSYQDRSKVAQMQNDLKDYLTKVIQKYNHGPNFTAVLQPFWTDINNDMEGLLAEDCFHLSPAGQELVAVNLWNNMLQPVNLKGTKLSQSKTVRCPTSNHPHLFTPLNSRKEDLANFSYDDALKDEAGLKSKPKSTLKVALGVGLSLFVVVVVIIAVVIHARKQKTMSMSDRIRILATPWKRMKEKV